MVDEYKESKTHYYHINLPRNEALEIRDQLVDTVMEIAQQEGVEKELSDVQFQIRVGKPALDPGTLITVIVIYIGTKTADKVIDKSLDKAWEAWDQKILPRLREMFGRDVLVDQEKKDED